MQIFLVVDAFDMPFYHSYLAQSMPYFSINQAGGNAYDLFNIQANPAVTSSRGLSPFLNVCYFTYAIVLLAG